MMMVVMMSVVSMRVMINQTLRWTIAPHDVDLLILFGCGAWYFNGSHITNYSPLLMTFASILLYLIWTMFLTRPINVGDYDFAVFIYCLCAIIESLAEPLWIVAQKLCLVKFVVCCLVVCCFVYVLFVCF
jgi:hypothetical protein